MTDPMTTEPLYFGFVVFIAFIASIVGGVSGFGAGLIITPFLLPIVGAKGIVPVVAVTMFVGNVGRIIANRREIDRRMVLRILLTIIPGVVLGAWIYSLLPSRVLAVIIGCALIASVPARRLMARRPVSSSQGQIGIVAFLAGVVAGNAPGGGVIVVSMLLSLGLHGPALIGTDAVIGAAISLTNTSTFGSLGLLTLDHLLLGLAIGAAMLPGAFAARALVVRMRAKIHVRIIETYIVLGGLTFFWSALQP